MSAQCPRFAARRGIDREIPIWSEPMTARNVPDAVRILHGPAPRPGIFRKQQVPAKAGIVPLDATTATTTQGSGPVLKHVRVFLVFWGPQWDANPVPSVDAVANAVTRILYSPYMSGLTQYEGIGSGFFEGKAVVSTPDPPDPFTTDDVASFLSAQLRLPIGPVPVPHFDNERLYCVIMPAGVKFKVTPTEDDIGAHSFLTGFPLRIPFAWTMNDGTLDFVTTVFSHELVESCTDPNPTIDGTKNGINVQSADCPSNSTCEIGDVCQSTDVVCGVRVQSYWSERDGRCIVPKGILPASVIGIPALIQGHFLPRGPDGLGNFEMVTPLSNGLAHFSRVNVADFVPWFGPNTFATDIGRFDAVSLIQSNFTAGAGIGNLELVGLFQGSLLYYYRDDVPPYTWHGPVSMNGFQPRLFSGNPVLIQGRFVPRAPDGRGNFEMVVPLAEGGIAHYSRVNTLPDVPWFGPNIFGTDVGKFDAVTMIQSNSTVGANIGDLELIARVGGDLLFYFREDVPPYTWYGPLTPQGFQPRLFSGNPVMIESRFGVGNFELIVPLADGGLAHYFRDNNVVSRPWSGPVVFGADIGRFDAVTFIQSNFTAGTGIGNLELVARVGDELYFYWRDDTLDSTWYGPCVLVAP
jgi:hypothetical protein